MDLQLRDKVILITGGSRGIGAAIVRAAAAEGAACVVVDRSPESAPIADGRIHLIHGDVTEPAICERAVSETIATFGRIDALVNNVGVNDRVTLADGTPEQFVLSHQRNLFHYFNASHYALPALKQSRGSILNIASKVAITGQGGTSGYVSAKGAILSLTREWAVELLPDQVRVNALVPAEVDTPLYQQWVSTFPDPAAKLASIVAKIPFGKRMTTPDEIAAMAVFLISAKASHITGQHVFVDGGYTHLDRAIS